MLDKINAKRKILRCFLGASERLKILNLNVIDESHDNQFDIVP